MSSQQPFTAVPVVGEVQHVSHLSDHLGKLYLSEEYSDVLLVLDDNKTIPAHKVTDNKLWISFLAPSGAQGVTLCVRPAQVCLKH